MELKVGLLMCCFRPIRGDVFCGREELQMVQTLGFKLSRPFTWTITYARSDNKKHNSSLKMHNFCSDAARNWKLNASNILSNQYNVRAPKSSEVEE